MIGMPAKIGDGFMMQIKPIGPPTEHMFAADRHCPNLWV
jgi:hypothetical protein